jgi:uncharacterized protein (DUF488 family)
VSAPIIHSIGHSIHPAETFLALLQAHGIEQLADVRSFPGSRRHPQYNAEALEGFLAAHFIKYRHFPALGGMRKPRPDSENTAWQNPGFRGYADYMEMPAFGQALDELIAFSAAAPTTVMCAEAVWWRCHRRLLADALLVRHVTVQHILTSAPAKPHELSEFAKIGGGKLSYPGLL